jgi:hypothetical protein
VRILGWVLCSPQRDWIGAFVYRDVAAAESALAACGKRDVIIAQLLSNARIYTTKANTRQSVPMGQYLTSRARTMAGRAFQQRRSRLIE